MNVFKNTDIAHEFNVSDPTVINWIQASLDGKNNLQLTKVKEKFKIIVNEHNRAELLRLSKISFTYRNKIQKSTVIPNPELYKILNQSQIIELINELKTNKQIPLKFSYLNQGAEIWDDSINKSLESGTYVLSNINDQLVNQSYDFLMAKIGKSKKVNVVDLGSGNAYPLKNLLLKLSKENILNKFIDIDISFDLANFAKKNVKTWLPNIQTEIYTHDFERNDMSDILFESKLKNEVVNLIFLFGGTYGNLDDRVKFLKLLRHSLDGEDLVIISNKISSVKGLSELGHLTSFLDLLIWLPKFLGIEVEKCEIVRRYEPSLESRAVFLKSDKDYEIEFKIKDAVKTVEILEGEEIILMKHHMSTLREVLLELDQAGLNLIHSTTTQNLSDLLFVCEPKKDL